MGNSSDRRLARLAARQLGLFTRAQAIECGLAPHMTRSRLRALRWEQLYPGVYRVAGTPETTEQKALAAVLAAGPEAAASNRTAAALWGLGGISPCEPEVVVPYERAPAPPGVRVYRSRTLRPGDTTRLGPIPLTSPARTLFDLSGVLGAEALEDVLDEALARSLVSRHKLQAMVAGDLRGLEGVRLLRRLLDQRANGHLGESAFENRVRRLLVAAGLPPPVPQFVVRDDNGRFIARVDLSYPQARLAIEADGYAYHSGRQAFERDRVRQNALVNAGWRVLRVTPTQADTDGAAVIDTVTRALGAPSVKRK